MTFKFTLDTTYMIWDESDGLVEDYCIQVTDENGRQTIMETGVTKWYKPEYLNVTLEYYRECNPTKQFELL